MKKVLLITAIVVLFVNITISNAAPIVKKTTDGPAKTNLIGINPLGLLLNMYMGEFGMIINDGENELNFPFFYWNPLDITMIGAGAKYRVYLDKNGTGIFYGGGVNIMSVSWSWSILGTEAETITGITVTPGVEIGYRWSWDNGFTVAPTIGAGFNIAFGDMKNSLGTTSSYGATGLSYSLGIGLAYMF